MAMRSLHIIDETPEGAAERQAAALADEAASAEETAGASSAKNEPRVLATPAGGPRPPFYKELRFEDIVTRVSKSSAKAGSTSVSMYYGEARRVLTVMLNTPEDGGAPFDAPFGLEVASNYKEPPSFLGGPNTGRPVEGLELLFSVPPDVADFFTLFEDHLRSMAWKNVKEWFGRPLRQADVERQFTPILKMSAGRAEEGREPREYPPRLRASVTLSAPPGQEHYLTRVTVVWPDSGVVETGCGWEWVKPRLEAGQTWKRAEIWATLELRSLWITAKGFGLRLAFRDLLVRPRATAHGSAYTDEQMRSLMGVPA